MQLISFSIKNYRSIEKTPKLPIDPELTVLIGPNNEGKSNLLRGFTCALDLLSFLRLSEAKMVGTSTTKPRAEVDIRRRTSRSFPYSWERDFPVSLQPTKTNGASIFTIELKLSEREIEEFRNDVGSNLNGTLPVEISVSPTVLSFRVVKPGRGAKALAKKANKIARFISNRLLFQHIEAVRSSEQAEEVVNRLVAEQLRTLEGNEDYKEALATIASLQDPILEAISATIKTNLSSFLPDVTDVRVEIPAQRRSLAMVRATQVKVNDGTETNLDAKGDGVQSLAAISLLRHRVNALPGNRDLIVAIEEPESHLHPSAMHRLQGVLKEIASEHQLVISTHNPVFVQRSKIGANILVEKKKAEPATNIAQIREILGVRIQDNLQSCEVALVVEGEEDRIAMQSLLSAESAQLRAAIASNRLGIDTLGGGTNLGYKLTQLRLSLCEIHVLLDDDDCGRDSLQKCLDANLLTVAQATLTKCQGMQHTELEDWFRRDIYDQHILDSYGVHIANGRFRHNDAKWSDRLKKVFEDSGKSWDKHVEAKIKSEVADLVVNSDDAIMPSRRNVFKSLVSSLEALLT